MVTIPVLDVCQVSVQPPARSVPVNCPAVTRVVTAAAGDAELQVTVKCTCHHDAHLLIYFMTVYLTYLLSPHLTLSQPTLFLRLYDDDTRQLFQTFKMLFISEQKRVLTFLFSEWRFWRIKFFLYFFGGECAFIF